MESYAKEIGMTKRFSINLSNDNLLPSTHINIRTKWFLDRLLSVVKAIVEYFFGMYVGAAIGWLLGWQTGEIYVEHFKPVYFSDLSSLNELTQWRFVPYDFANNGVIIGAIAGSIVIAIINRRLLNKRFASLYLRE